MLGNVVAACVLGATLWLYWGVPFVWASLGVALSFVLLMASLLSRYTSWISALFGGLAMSIAPAASLGGLGMKMGSPTLAWIGSATGLVFGTAVSVMSHRHVLRSEGSGTSSDDSR